MSSDVAEKAGEVAAEVVEETVDGVVDVVEVVRNNPVAVVAAGTVGLVLGAVGGYFLAKRKLSAFYEDLAMKEIAEARTFYRTGVAKIGDDGEILTPQDVLRARHGAEALSRYQGKGPVHDDPEGQPEGEPADEKMDEELLAKTVEKARLHSVSVDAEPGPHGGKIEMVEQVTEETRNVFSDPNFDLEEELKKRSPVLPYVIHHDEYFEAVKDYENEKLTYFEGDDVLVNERDEPINEVDATIGDESIARFGHGSKDPNIVYVRNDVLQIDYEVHRDPGTYLQALGLGPEPDGPSLKHSADRRREFRHGDG